MRILLRTVLVLPILIGCRFFIASPEECAAACDAPTSCCTPPSCPALLDCSAMPPADRIEAPAPGPAIVATILPRVQVVPAELADGTTPREAPVAETLPLWLELRRLLL